MFTLSRGISLLTALVLVGTSASAETYRVLEGSVSVGETSEPLTGALELSLFDSSVPEPTVLLADDFALQTGEHSFVPNPPVEYQGLRPIVFLEVADHIQLYGDAVGLFWLRSGGDFAGLAGDEVTFRFLDFRPGPSGGGRAVGQLADSELPRRLYLEGALYEVDQTFRIRESICPLPLPRPLPPPPDGGVILDSNLHLSFNRFDIDLGETIYIPRDGSSGTISRVTSRGSRNIIEGELREVSEVLILPELGFTSASFTPTLEELGISAPAGATVGYDEITGELSIDSDGDIFVEGTAIDLPGLTRLSIGTSGGITITGNLTLPPDVVLYLEAAYVTVDGVIEAPGGIEIITTEIVTEPSCPLALWPIFPTVERAVGSFSLVASAARQVDVDVRPRHRRNRVQPGQPEPIWAAILGSEDLDARDIDETTLRLGPGEAEPTSRLGRQPTRLGHANRDRLLDLMARFDVRETGIAYGDTEVCLVAATTDGETLEGCDRIQTLPEWLSLSLRRVSGRNPRGQ